MNRDFSLGVGDKSPASSNKSDDMRIRFAKKVRTTHFSLPEKAADKVHRTFQWLHLPFKPQTDVHGPRGMGERADRDDVHPSFRHFTKIPFAHIA